MTTATERRPRLHQRYFAWLMHHVARRYDLALAERKRELLADLRGTVVEIGPGTGANLRYFDRSVRWIGVEPNPAMRARLEREANRQGRTVELHAGFGERLPLADASADAVVSTLVLCSVRDLPGTLREVRRVLRPGGAFVFLEHVAAPRGTALRLAQGAVAPLWARVNDGCRLDREVEAALGTAGFTLRRVEPFRGPLPIPVVRPHVMGVAIVPE